jgi:hypothetical protein
MAAFPLIQFFLFNVSKIYYSGGYHPCQSIRVLVGFFTEGRSWRSFFRIAREDYKEGLDKRGKTS